MTRGDRATCDAAVAEASALAAELDDPNASRTVAMHRFHLLLVFGTADELAELVEQAEARGDVRRAETAQAELEALRKELARGVGLGGRVRRSGAAAERARITAQRRIREAIKKIGEIEPEVAASLDKAIKTGTYCAYNSPK